MLVSFPSVSTGLNANAKEFVPSFVASPPPSPLSQNDPLKRESAVFRPLVEETFSKAPRAAAVPARRKGHSSVFEHPPAVSPIPQYDPRQSSRLSSAHEARRRHAHASRSSRPDAAGRTVSSSQYAPPSSFSRSHKSVAVNRRSRHSDGSSLKELKVESLLKMLISQWHVREGVGRLIVLRGLPGSGKSTLASHISRVASHAVVCSTDRYFAMRGLERDPARNKEARRACRREFCAAVNIRSSLVVLDNVNAERWQYSYEIDTAKRLGYSVRVWEFERNADDLALCYHRQSHGVSQPQFLSYCRQWEKDSAAQVLPILRNM